MSDLFHLDRPAAAGPPLRHKIFFALYPDRAVSLAVHELARRRRGPGGWLMPPGRQHVSMNGVARTSEPSHQLIDRAMAAGSTVAMRPFVIAFNRLGSWGRGRGDRSVVLWGDEGVAGAVRLHDALHRALAAAGVVRPAEPPFEPHLTLLRNERDLTQEFIPMVRWWVREFVLLDSIHGEGRHEVLGRWRLAG